MTEEPEEQAIDNPPEESIEPVEESKEEQILETTEESEEGPTEEPSEEQPSEDSKEEPAEEQPSEESDEAPAEEIPEEQPSDEVEESPEEAPSEEVKAGPDDQLTLADLEKEREELNREAEDHKRRRNILNDKTKEWVEKRDFFNAKVRGIVDEASMHRESRDGLNEEVQGLKKDRDEWNAKVNELTESVSRIKRRNLPKGRIPLGKLKKDLRALEFRQMTSVLTPDKEKDLIEDMSRIENEIKARETELEENEEVKLAIKELRETKAKAEALHKKVGEVADAAQMDHDKMTELYETSDGSRKEADLAQEEFIKTKMLADEEHRMHIDYIRKVHDLDKIISGMRFKHRMARVRGDEKVAMREAEDIYGRFKKGEKLSTEDLMTLQKSGYL
ncbi:MAG: phosphoserine phosphatase [Thermoplasmata archaeon]